VTKKKADSGGAKLVQAYRQMLERIRQMLDTIESKTEPVVQKAFNEAKETAIKLGELSHEEAERIATYVKRDVLELAHFLDDTGKLIQSKTLLDWHYIEDRLIELLQSIADRSRTDMMKFEEDLVHGPEYRSGEIISIGTLRCTDCGKLLHFLKVSHIPPCPDCHGHTFGRALPPSQ